MDSESEFSCYKELTAAQVKVRSRQCPCQGQYC